MDPIADDLSRQLQWWPEDGVLDLRVGLPGPSLWPTEAFSSAVEAVARRPRLIFPYGADAGPMRLREAIAARSATREKRPVDLEQILVTGGTSSALDELSGWLGASGDTVLVEDLTYNLALRIFADHGLAVEAVERDEQGMVVSDLEAKVRRLDEENRSVAFAYVMPTFHNPTGGTWSLGRRERIAGAIEGLGITVLEDDAYRELYFDAEPRPSLRADLPARVLRLGTFSKTLGPGLRVGWLEAAPALIEDLASRGVRRSGGGANHTVACAVGELIRTEDYDHHIERLRQELTGRRAVLRDSLARLPEGSGWRWQEPGGGYFAWIRLPAGGGAAVASGEFADHGVRVMPGSAFGPAGKDAIRLAISFWDGPALARALAALYTALGPVPDRSETPD